MPARKLALPPFFCEKFRMKEFQQLLLAPLLVKGIFLGWKTHGLKVALSARLPSSDVLRKMER
jgi:hypothetical protein